MASWSPHTRALGLGMAAALAGAASPACGEGEAATPETADAQAEAGVDALDPIARGAIFVRNRACASCHQSPDPADGVLSGQTTPRLGTMAFPANITPDTQTGIGGGGWTDAKILRAIRLGVDDSGGPLCPQMPRFNEMTDTEGYAIVAYLRSVPPVRRAIPRSTCIFKPAPGDGGAVDAADGG